MEFMKIDLPLPPIFAELEEKMDALQALQEEETNLQCKWSIAGGCLSNLYMNKPFRDIDIFADFKMKEEEIMEVFGEGVEIEYKQEFGSYGDSWNVPYLYRLAYKGYTVEIIASSQHRIFDFDLRFRYFFLQRGTVYAAKDALQDIKEEQIVIVSPNSPLSTLFRTFRFQREFGFSIDETSFSFLTWYLNTCTVEQTYIQEYLEKQITKVGREVVEAFNLYLDPYWSSDPYGPITLYFPKASFPFHEDLKDVVLDQLRNVDHPCFGLYYEPLKQYKPKELSWSIPVSVQHVLPYVHMLQEKLKVCMAKNVFSSSFIPFTMIKDEELDQKWQDYLRNPNLLPLLQHHLHHEDQSILGRLFEVELLPETVEVIGTPSLDTDAFSLGDIVHQNIWQFQVENIVYYVRKTEHGKFTLSGIDLSKANGSFYLKTIGEALVQAYPETFEFGNQNVHACYAFTPYSVTPERFFSARAIQHPFDTLTTDNYIPISSS